MKKSSYILSFLLSSLFTWLLISCKTDKDLEYDESMYITTDTVYNINGTIITSPRYTLKKDIKNEKEKNNEN